MKKIYEFPSYLEIEIKRIFHEKNWAWNSKNLAEDVLQLSDYYIQNPEGQTPWEKEWAQRASLVYFWPLNTLRLLKIRDELFSLNFFKELERMIDFGAGTGTASWLLRDLIPDQQLIERSVVPQSWFKQMNWTQKIQSHHKALTVFSYSLTEVERLPDWSLATEALLIIEPSTQQDGRNLLQLRQNLIEQDFLVWAPCPHQDLCPLFTKSKNDWCHDRVHILKPDWFENIEKYLPMKNKTLTFSYLALRKTPVESRQWSRLVGDQLLEKGKTRQLICRNSEREFLSWMQRDGSAPELGRGDRIILSGFEKKSNELRAPKVSFDE